MPKDFKGYTENSIDTGREYGKGGGGKSWTGLTEDNIEKSSSSPGKVGINHTKASGHPGGLVKGQKI